MKSHGEIESAVCEAVTHFEQDYMGRGPKDIHTHLLGDLLVVRLQGVLTAAEQQLVKSLSAEKGRDLLKQVRTHLIETARPVMEAMVEEITGVKVLSLHHDISTATGEEIVLFRQPDKNNLPDVLWLDNDAPFGERVGTLQALFKGPKGLLRQTHTAFVGVLQQPNDRRDAIPSHGFGPL